MKLNPDDARLTAYALGELTESERAEIEAELKSNPECREMVDEIRRTAKLLAEDFATEPHLMLSGAQREMIEEKLQPSNIVWLPRQKIYWTAGIAAVAACVMFVAVWQAGVFSKTKRTREVASANVTKTATERMKSPSVSSPVQSVKPEVRENVLKEQPITTIAPPAPVTQ